MAIGLPRLWRLDLGFPRPENRGCLLVCEARRLRAKKKKKNFLSVKGGQSYRSAEAAKGAGEIGPPPPPEDSFRKQTGATFGPPPPPPPPPRPPRPSGRTSSGY